MARVSFRTLWTVEVRHGFWGGPTDALAFVVPPSTERRLAGLKALARASDGRLHVLAEVGADDAPLGALLGQTLVFGLAPRSSAFTLATAPDGITGTRVWDNAADADTLAGPRALAVTGSTPRLQATLATRPLTMRLLDAAGNEIARRVLGPGEDGWSPLLPLVRGDHQLEEQAGGPALRRPLRVDPELAGAWGLLALTVSADHAANGHSFVLDFAARRDTLRYYVVAQRHDAEQFAQVGVVDTGADADGRDPIEFDRVERDALGDDHLAPALLDPAGSARIACFQARAAVARRARGPSGLQLHRNGTVLVGHLPQPGAERHDAQFVVHLSLT